MYEFAGEQGPLKVTASFAYIRLRGPGGPYQGSYGDAALQTWAARIAAWAKRGLDVYCYFDNDERGYAPQDALRLRRMLP